MDPDRFCIVARRRVYHVREKHTPLSGLCADGVCRKEITSSNVQALVKVDNFFLSKNQLGEVESVYQRIISLKLKTLDRKATP